MPVLPQKLIKGDTIGIVSPAGAIKDYKALELTKNYFESQGYKVKVAPHAMYKKAYLAGKDNDRLADLLSFIADPEIKAIFCSRGGYGSFRLLENIDWNLMRNNPKIIVGYSDITALLNNFAQKSDMVSFLGPLALPDFGVKELDKYTEENFWKIIEGRAEIPFSYENPVNYQCLNSGIAQGVLIGGNLSILCGLLGTPYFPNVEGKIILIEDIAEPLYKIDRMLMQLKLAGVFNKVSGVLFGEFTSIVQSDDPEINKLTPVNIINEVIGDFNIPIGYGFASSHDTKKATLPLGIKYNFDSENFKLEIAEAYIA